MDWPEITILICTFERQKELAATVDALRDRIYYPPDQLRWLICDDSSPSKYAERLSKRPGYRDLHIEVVSTDKQSGWGRNVNNGNAHVQTEFTFFIEDDYVLIQPLDLRVGVAAMLEMPYVGMMRYRGTAGDHVILHQMNVNISKWIPDYQDGTGLAGNLTYCLLDCGSPTLYIYSHGAHLKRRNFHQFYGAYPEGLKLGQTEEAMAHQVKNKMRENGAPPIGILPGWIPCWFDHIGVSYQNGPMDK